MGLDVTGYSEVEYVHKSDTPDHDYDDCWNENRTRVYVHPYYRDRADGILENSCWTYKSDYPLHAGSYSGYGWWRRTLADAVLFVDPNDVWDNPEDYEGEPFFELINFSDCEGTIGAKTSAKLLQDFKEWREVVFAEVERMGADPRNHDVDSTWGVENFKYLYDEWTKVFEYAANDGFVSFH